MWNVETSSSAVRWAAFGMVGVFVLAGGVAFYAFWIEPYLLVSTFHRVTGAVRQPLRIAHITDLHTAGLYRRERDMVARVREEKPDLIVITGDNLNQFYDFGAVAEVLSQLEAPLGVWMVRGNWEKAVPLEEETDEEEKDERTLYRKAGVNLLVNEVARPRSDFWLLGFDDMETEASVIDEVVSRAGTEYRIALFHSPGVFPRLADKVQLALAGHTHGGQVRLPGLSPLYLPSGSGGFVEGWYERRGARMFVSRGVGNTVVDMRLGCRPEIAFIEVIPEDPAGDSSSSRE